MASKRKGTIDEQKNRDRFTLLRSMLRRIWMRDPHRVECLYRDRVPHVGDNKRRKWSYPCAICGQHFMLKEITVDHIRPAGTFLCYEDFKTFVPNLFCDVEGLRLLCKPCHKIRTQLERRRNEPTK